MNKSISSNAEAVFTRVKAMVEDIKCIPRETFRRILLYSIIDSFAQSWNGFVRENNAKIFSDFICKYASENNKSVLNEICPVTIYNYYHQKFPMGELRLSDKCLENSKKRLLGGPILTAGNKILINEASRLLGCIGDEKERKIAEQKHTYSRLMYADRNKRVHELNAIGGQINFCIDSDIQLPHVVKGSRLVSGKMVEAPWALHIPEAFISAVLFDSVRGYLDECIQQNRDPVSSNLTERLSRYAWYD